MQKSELLTYISGLSEGDILDIVKYDWGESALETVYNGVKATLTRIEIYVAREDKAAAMRRQREALKAQLKALDAEMEGEG